MRRVWDGRVESYASYQSSFEGVVGNHAEEPILHPSITLARDLNDAERNVQPLQAEGL